MKRDDVFVALRQQVLDDVAVKLPKEIVARSNLLPIEGTVDGYYCLASNLCVVHVDHAGSGEEALESPRRATAMIGTLVRRFPLATALLLQPSNALVCKACGGTGTVPGLPLELAKSVHCECGGLGWVPD